MDKPRVRLMIVDDHDLIRRGIRDLLIVRDDVEIVGEASESQEALRIAEQSKVDIAVVDYMLPGLDGVGLARSLQRSGLCTATLLYTMYEDPQLMCDTIDAGVRGIVLKTDSSNELLVALDAILTGKVYFPSALFHEYLTKFVERKGPRDILTPREREVVQHVVEGDSNKWIADKLRVSEKTIETHRSSAMHKLKLRSTADLVRWAIRSNLIQA